MATVTRPHKYGARRTEYPSASGTWFPSKGEAEYARRLDLLQAAGQIREWQRGRRWVLLEPPNTITFTPDFEVVTADGRLELHEFKGYATAVFKLKARLFRARYPDISLVIVQA